MEKEPYNQIDHVHCWNQKVPACGIEKASHKVCCLCEKPMENKETNEKKCKCSKDNEFSYVFCPIHSPASTPVVEKSGWEARFDKEFLYWVVMGSTLNNGSELRWNVGDGKMPNINTIKDFIKNVEKEAGEKGYADGYADGIEIHKNIQEIARLEGKKEEEQEIKERLTKILKAATGNSGTIAVTPEVIMSNLFPEE